MPPADSVKMRVKRKTSGTVMGAHNHTTDGHRAHHHGGHGGGTPHHLHAPTPSRPKRVRGLFDQEETLYADVDTAKRAFESERINKALRERAPTPYHRSTGSDETLHRVDSRRSLKHRVSFESIRSQHPVWTKQDLDDVMDQLRENKMALGPWEPSFGARNGIGPAGESYEVLGLGRKSPRHRKFHSHMLKPAIKSRNSSRTDLRGDYNQGHGGGHHHHRPPSRPRRDKPLPSRPLSCVTPSLGNFFSSTANLSRQMLAQESTPHHRPTPISHPPRPRATSSTPAPAHAHTRSFSLTDPTSAAFRSLFNSLNLDNSTPSSSRQRLSLIDNSHNHNGSRTRRDVVIPAEDLFSYLHLATVKSWQDWPASGPPARYGTLLRSARSKGFENMGWEWRRRLQLAEANRHTRGLRSWDGVGKYWDKKIVEWVEENVPSQPIDTANRWGNQIFALPANGFDTLEFFDENRDSAEDGGILGWLTGSLLQTITSTLHMLRYSSSPFAFHLIPGPRPPLPSPLLDDEKPNETYSGPHALWEGFGTMVLVNKDDPSDRAMIIEVRPPDVVDERVLREFSRRGRGDGWWHLPSETCIGEAGQANLLQAQNNVYYFAVTNLKQWVFGSFNSSYSSCTTSPVIERKQREPSLVQCLATWTIRSVDERPRRSDRHAVGQRASVLQTTQIQGDPQSQPHTELRARRSATPTPMSPNQMSYGFNQDSNYQISQNAFQAFTSTPTMQHQHQLPHQHQHHHQQQGMPPDYYDMMNGAGPGGYPQPQASYGGVMGAYPMWNASQRAFSPLPNYGAANGSWYSNGFGWGMR